MQSFKDKIAKIFVLIIILLSIPLFIKVADFSRYAILVARVDLLIYGIIRSLFIKNPLLFLVGSLIFLLINLWSFHSICKRKLYKDPIFYLFLIIIIVQTLPAVTLFSVDVNLFLFYVSLFIVLLLFFVLSYNPYRIFSSIAKSFLILFPVFSIILLVGFNSVVLRPKKTVLNGGPEHYLLDSRCDRNRLLSQKEIKPIWLEDAWLYDGVATKDGKYLYFVDNGYGLLGFERMEHGEYVKLPPIKYPNDFNAALYSHRLYLTPDEKYLFYYGARSAEFVFINRERMEVAYVIPTENGLDGFSAAIDTKRNLIYGFPFIGKRIPVVSYEEGVPRLIKWIDFSQIPGWAIEGVYNNKRDILIISTSMFLSIYDAMTLEPKVRIEYGSLPTRIFSSDKSDLIFLTTPYDNKVKFVNLSDGTFKEVKSPGFLNEAEEVSQDRMVFLEFIRPYIWIYYRHKDEWKSIYVGTKPRGIAHTGDKIFISSVCGVLEIDM